MLSAIILSAAIVGGLEFEVSSGDSTGIPQALRAWPGSQNPYFWVWLVCAWDQNNDLPDIVVTDHNANGSRIFRNNGDGTFADVTDELALGIAAKDLPHEYRPVVMDVDNDGRLDLVPSTQGTLRVLLNRGDRLVLGGPVTDLASKFGRTTNLNNDTFADFTQHLRDYGKTTIADFVNDTRGGFLKTVRDQPRPEGLPQSIVDLLDTLAADRAVQNRYGSPLFFPADLNGDSIDDLVLQYAGSYTGDVVHRFGRYFIFRDGAFIQGDVGIPTSLVPLAMADFSGDGKADFLCGYGPEAGLYVQGDAGFARIPNADLTALLRGTTTPYLPEAYQYDFDRDGDLDLLITMMRLGCLEVYDNQGAGVFKKVLRAHHWDSQGFAVADFTGDGLLDIAVGGPGPVNKFVPSFHRDTQFTLYRNVANPVVTVRLRHPLEDADPAAPETVRFLRWCDGPAFGQDAFRLALAFKISGDQRYATRAATLVNAYVTEANVSIAAGNAPKIAADSYLNIYRDVRSLIFPLAWCPNEFSAEQKEAALAICKQAVWNVWHHQEATWGGKLHKWSGWAVNNPRNNYHQYFVGATALLAIYGQGDQGLAGTHLRGVADAHAYRGGGSAEGTGYGLSHATMYEIFGTWSASTGEHFPAIEQHARDSIGYWVHATAPGGRFVATIGDQARDSAGGVYDYHRATILWAQRLAGRAASAEDWLNAHPSMRHGFNYHDDLVTK